jgi:hypothetical protein
MQSVGNEMGEFGLGVGRSWRVFRTGEEVRDEPGTHASYDFVAVEGVLFGRGRLLRLGLSERQWESEALAPNYVRTPGT